MAIPNVKRFRPFCPTCNENFTIMAVLPQNANVDQYLTDAVARHDHKAYQESKQAHFKVRVGHYATREEAQRTQHRPLVKTLTLAVS